MDVLGVLNVQSVLYILYSIGCLLEKLGRDRAFMLRYFSYFFRKTEVEQSGDRMGSKVGRTKPFALRSMILRPACLTSV